jgi:phosphoglycolate phosphatase-like HAD superfamily hydrolase
MVGDDSRDVESAQAAGVIPVVVDWGYSDPGADAWGATHRVADPTALLELVGLRLRP